MKISEILHKAADEFLWDGVSCDKHLFQYSCDAVGGARIASGLSFFDYQTKDFLHSLGLKPRPGSAFIEFEEDDEATEASQGARYLWLKFAALVAEEEGI